ncbi:hypothetical protein S83_053498 [Arachis hypogaea]
MVLADIFTIFFLSLFHDLCCSCPAMFLFLLLMSLIPKATIWFEFQPSDYVFQLPKFYNSVFIFWTKSEIILNFVSTKQENFEVIGSVSFSKVQFLFIYLLLLLFFLFFVLKCLCLLYLMMGTKYYLSDFNLIKFILD